MLPQTKTVLRRASRFVWLLPLLVACADFDGDYSTSTSHRLRFSTDTLRLDTVLTGIGSSTRTLSVYNPNPKGLRLTDVRLAEGEASPFRVNIDGTSIHKGIGQPLDVRAGDSLAVFVELTASETDEDLPTHLTDRLIFTLESGNQQTIVLDAYGQDVITLQAVSITGDTTLAARRPYLVYDGLTVAEGSTLTLAPGTRLYFHQGAGLTVAGTLVATGTREQPIVFRGDRTDRMFAEQPYDRIAGQWQGIVFTPSSYANRLDFCDVHAACTAMRLDSSDVSREKLRLENSVVHNNKGDGLYARNCRLFVGNSQLTNALGNCVMLVGGHATFVHCTLANFYPFDAQSGVALYFTNEAAGKPCPLEEAAFENCLITGYSSDEVFGVQSADERVSFHFRFSHSLLNTAEFTDEERLEAVVWDKKTNPVSREKNFLPFNTKHLFYSFALDSLSLAVGLADPAITRRYYPYDRQGIERLIDGKANAGCYE